MKSVSQDSARPVADLAKRLFGFTGWPLLSLITPLVATPIVARYAGDGWSGIVTAMSIGTFGSALTAWGWNYLGPAKAALTADTERPRLYAESIRSRLLMTLLCLPVIMVVTALLANASIRIPAVLIACAFTLGGMSPQWYCIGIGRPALLGIFDTLPRALATLLAVPLMLGTRSILPYPILLIAAVATSLYLFSRRIFPASSDSPAAIGQIPWKDAWHSICSMASVAAANLIGVAYAYAPVPLATALLTSLDSSRFASGDQLYRYALFAVTALGNALQGWTLEVDGAAGQRRQKAAIWLHTCLGLLGAGALIVLGPWASSVLFGAELTTSQTAITWYAVAFAFISFSTPLLRNLLIPDGRQKRVLMATGVSAVVGLATMGVAGWLGNAPAIAAGMALSEALIIALTASAARRVFRHRYQQAKPDAES